mgnify:CR=1 FL=1
MKQKAEEIYHRFVNYEWNDVGEGLKKSILEAIETALKEGQKLPIHNVSVSVCSCEMPAKVKGKNECWRCKKPFKEFLKTER